MKNFKTTEEIPVPEKLINQVIGQEKAVEIIKKAAKQKRNVLLIGSPGTGKSMLAQAMAEIMPLERLEDVLVYPNSLNENQPLVRVVPTYPNVEFLSKHKEYEKYYTPLEAAAIRKYSEEKKEQLLPRLLRTGLGRRVVQFQKPQEEPGQNISPNILIALLAVVLLSVVFFSDIPDNTKWLVFAVVIGLGFLFMLSRLTSAMQKRMMSFETPVPKLIVDNTGNRTAPFVDATGAKAGALLGDVKHDPLQCIPGDELVYLSNGKPAKISDLVDKLLPEGGERELNPSETFEILGGFDERYCYSPARVSRVFKRKFEGEMYEITTRRGLRISVTPNHPLAFVREDGAIDYAEAGKIGKNASLVLPYRLPVCKNAEYSDDFITLAAYLLADGYFAPRAVGFKVKRQFKIECIERCLRANKLPYRKRVYRGATIFNVNSAALVRKFISMGLKSSDLKSSGRKSIPSFVFDLDRAGTLRFVSSYLSFGGYVNKQGQFELFSKELVDDFSALLLKLGVRAKIGERLDRGYGREKGTEKGTMQRFLRFSSLEFALDYSKLTTNPCHIQNLSGYLASAQATHVTYDDEVPLSFATLEKIREKTGLSQGRVHKAYYALKPGLRTSKNLTRQFLASICTALLAHTNGPELLKLKNIADGSYAFDTIASIRKMKYKGYVYNLTTETGNYLVKGVLTHNSGGLGTPAHLRVESGAIHKANKGVLFIDEIASLKYNWQQELLTAMQEKKYFITGQSEMSSGALVKTEPVPSDFVLVAAGNLPDMEHIHPALRSRIRGSGYEVYMEDSMNDNEENRDKLVQFVAQEVKRDGKIPHFSSPAVLEIIEEAKRMSGRKGKLTMNLREIGGLIRAAGDVAMEENAPVVLPEHVKKGKKIFSSVEFQLSKKIAEQKKEYRVFANKGLEVGRVNGLAVLGDSLVGLVLPIVAEITPSASKSEGRVIATGKLGQIAKEAVDNVFAILKKYESKDLSHKDVHIQFLQTYEGVEGDSASISIAVGVISALENIPLNQSFALTGSLSVRGDVLPVGGINGKIEAAIDAGMKNVIIPKANEGDVYLPKELLQKIKVIPVSNIAEVLECALQDTPRKRRLVSEIRKNLRAADWKKRRK